MRYVLTMLVAVAAMMLTACESCNQNRAAAPAGYAVDAAGMPVDITEVIAEPVDGFCLTLPLINCKLCIGFSCSTPEIVTPASFGQRVQRAPAAAYDPCGPAPAAAYDPCASGSASDVDGLDYGEPPAHGYGCGCAACVNG